MSVDLKRARVEIESSDSENEEQENLKKAKIDEKEEDVLEEEPVEGERMRDILREQKQNGASIEGFVLLKKNGIWEGKFKCVGECLKQNAYFLARKGKKDSWAKVKKNCNCVI